MAEPGAAAEEDVAETRDYEFVWFNAWLYDDTDNMWVGLVQELHEAVEQHYGADYAFAQRRAGLLQILAQVFAVLGVVAALVTWFVNEYDFYGDVFATSGLSLLKNAKAIATVIGGVTALVISIGSARSFSRKENLRSAQLAHDAGAKDFRKLGYAKRIKDDIKDLAQVLDDPTKIKTIWHYLLPDWLPLAVRDKFLEFQSKRVRLRDALGGCWRGGCLNTRPKQKKKCRLV